MFQSIPHSGLGLFLKPYLLCECLTLKTRHGPSLQYLNPSMVLDSAKTPKISSGVEAVRGHGVVHGFTEDPETSGERQKRADGDMSLV